MGLENRFDGVAEVLGWIVVSEVSEKRFGDHPESRGDIVEPHTDTPRDNCRESAHRHPPRSGGFVSVSEPGTDDELVTFVGGPEQIRYGLRWVLKIGVDLDDTAIPTGDCVPESCAHGSPDTNVDREPYRKSACTDCPSVCLIRRTIVNHQNGESTGTHAIDDDAHGLLLLEGRDDDEGRNSSHSRNCTSDTGRPPT